MIPVLFLAALTCNGMNDDTSAWNAALEMADAGSDKTIELPAGTCILNNPTPITRGINVRGQGKSWTVLQCQTSSCLRVCDMGSNLSDFSIFAGPSVRGGIGLAVSNCDGKAAGNHVLEHIWITSGTGGGTWGVPIHVDGSLRSLPPAGMRAVIINDVTVFNGSSWLGVLWNCIACEWRGGGPYQGAGSAKGIAIGGASSQNIRLDIVYDGASSVIWPGVLR